MTALVVVCPGCGVRIKTTRPEVTLGRTCPKCATPLAGATILRLTSSSQAEPGTKAKAATTGQAAKSGAGLSIWLAATAVASIALATTAFVLQARLRQVAQGPPPPPPHAGSSNAAARANDASPNDRPASTSARPSMRVEPMRVEPSLLAQRAPASAAPPPVANPPRSILSVGGRVPPPPPHPDVSTTPPTTPGPSQGMQGGSQRQSPPPSPSAVATGPPEHRRVRVGDDSGQTMVARLYGDERSRLVLLPDGQIGRPDSLVFTDDPFEPQTIRELRETLLAGPYKGFQVIQTDHYLVFYQSSAPFAKASANLLESLYRGLLKSLRDKGLPVHESEFPLIAVIDRREKDFRARKEIDPEVQAYYDIFSNRIFLFEEPDHREGPEVFALRQPQTVAHEGTHQVLQNIGVQPRLAPWPLWLVEGLAEFCAPTATKRGEWAGFSKVNPFHMATLRELDDPLSMQLANEGQPHPRVGRAPGTSMSEWIVTQTQLSPTDYALAWALIHHLANQRTPDFIAFLKKMGQLAPRQPRKPADDLDAFRKAFGQDLKKLDRSVAKHLAALKNYDPIAYYAVVFEQPVGHNLVRRGGLVSQSPSHIRQWLEEMRSPNGGPVAYLVTPFTTRGDAFRAAQHWLDNR
jgi:hypothetical protein